MGPVAGAWLGTGVRLADWLRAETTFKANLVRIEFAATQDENTEGWPRVVEPWIRAELALVPVFGKEP